MTKELIQEIKEELSKLLPVLGRDPNPREYPSPVSYTYLDADREEEEKRIALESTDGKDCYWYIRGYTNALSAVVKRLQEEVK